MRDYGVGEYSSECSHRDYGFMFRKNVAYEEKLCCDLVMINAGLLAEAHPPLPFRKSPKTHKVK